jgi:hypothetical protein
MASIRREPVIREARCFAEGLRDRPGCRETKKKTKDKALARSVNRQEIIDGAEELGVPLDEHIDFCVKAMQARAEELGLKGSASLP